MSTGMLLPPIAPAVPSPSAPSLPRRKQWTCDEFHRVGDSGAFEGQNLILIDGEILEMPAAGSAHDVAMTLLDDQLRKIFSSGFVIRSQMSLVLGKSIDPIPDLVVVQGSPRDFLQKPTTALLVAEVSDSSLDYDTNDKASLYAAARIADYWVVDLVNRQLIVHRNPQVDASKTFGFAYANVTSYFPGQSASPLAAPNSAARVGDLLP